MVINGNLDMKRTDKQKKTFAANKVMVKDIEKFDGSGNDFLQSIYDNAWKWQLSYKQVNAANSAWVRKTAPQTVWIDLDDDRKEAIILVIKYIIRYAVQSMDMLDSIDRKIRQNSRISEKQYAVIMKKAQRYRKDIFARAFGEKQ